MYEDTQLRVSVNGEYIYRDMIVLSKNEAQNIVVESNGEPYSVKYKNGIKTVGQMKSVRLNWRRIRIIQSRLHSFRKRRGIIHLMYKRRDVTITDL